MQSSIKISGVKETISELKKLEPELLKQMRKDIKKEPGIVSAISAIKSKAPAVAPLSGMTHGGRTSYAKPRVSASFRPSVKLDRVNQRSIISIVTTPPKNQAGFEIIDMAGRGGGRTRKQTTRPYEWRGVIRTHSISTQGRAMIDALASSPSRYVWKAIEGRQASLTKAALNIVESYSKKANVKLRTK